jgi:hypothetical protein
MQSPWCQLAGSQISVSPEHADIFLSCCPMTAFRKKIHLVPILVLLAVWSGWFIHQSSFEIEGQRWYSLFDDSMITMTYAKNLTQGHGLNWAKFGEPVEGYTSPLWMFVMIPFQLLPIAWGKVSLAFMIFSAALLLANVVILDHLLERRFRVQSIPVRGVAAFSLAFLYPMNFWTLEGMEPGAQVTLFLLGLNFFCAFEENHSIKELHRLGTVLALALLLRMDMVFFVGWVILFLAPWLIRNRMVARHFLAIVTLPMLGYLVFRMIYFHDILPNTYYLKLYKIPLDIRLERGWFYFAEWAERLWLVWLLIPVAVIPIVKQRRTWLILLLIITYLAYNVYAGGDAWEESGVGANRFTVIVLPLMLVLLAVGGNAWREWVKGAGKWISLLLPMVGCLVLMILVNSLLFMPEREKHWNRFLVIERPYNTTYHTWNTMKAISLNQFLGPGNRVATVQAGSIGYFADCQLVDFLGYNNRVIAKLEPYWDLHALDIIHYVPGHVKVDYRHTIADLQPDYILDNWTKFSPEVDQQFHSLLETEGYVPHPERGWIKADYQRREK